MCFFFHSDEGKLALETYSKQFEQTANSCPPHIYHADIDIMINVISV